ncbi:MAG: M14 family zinc carboxypeptidase, partial [Candidatus Bathyarchaeia archaeon]
MGKLHKAKCFLLIFSFLGIMAFYVPLAHAGPYRDYDSYIASFKNLANSYPNLITYEAIGKTVLGKEILMFKIGNPAGGKVLFDGAIHGWESLGGELLYLYAKWLLTSRDPLAYRILSRDYTLLIPAPNTDGYNKWRTNANHVDLNRNFATNWEN